MQPVVWGEMQPTEKQIKEFWEWCGWYLEDEIGGEAWHHPDFKDSRPKAPGYAFHVPHNYRETLPPIDFNNLFKWAVPDDLAVEFMPHGNMIECKLLYRYSMNAETLLDTPYGWRIKGIGKAPTRILALFWAIYTIQKKRQ